MKIRAADKAAQKVHEARLTALGTAGAQAAQQPFPLQLQLEGELCSSASEKKV